MAIRTIDDFKSALAGSAGPARSNRFEVKLACPSVIADPSERISMLCKSASIPGRTIITQEYQNVRHAIKKPYNMMNTDVVLTFHLTNDYLARKVFKKWIESVVSSDLAFVNYKDDYKGTVEITQLDGAQNSIYRVRLEEAYPIDIAVIELNSATENEILELSVTFTYTNYIESEEVHRTGPGLAISQFSVPGFNGNIIAGKIGNFLGPVGNAVETIRNGGNEIFNSIPGNNTIRELQGRFNSNLAPISNAITRFDTIVGNTVNQVRALNNVASSVNRVTTSVSNSLNKTLSNLF